MFYLAALSKLNRTDEVSKERVRLIGSGLKLGVKLRSHKKRVVAVLDYLN
jgi:hypothetical protein